MSTNRKSRKYGSHTPSSEDVASLRYALNAKKDDTTKLQKEVNRLRRDLSEFQNTRAASDERLEAAEGALARALKERDDLAQEVAALREENGEFKATNDSIFEDVLKENDALRDMNQELLKGKEALEEAVATRAEVQELYLQNAELSELSHNLSVAVNTIEGSLKLLVTTLSIPPCENIVDTFKKVSTAVEELLEARHNCEEQLSVMTAHNTEMQREVQELRGNILNRRKIPAEASSAVVVDFLAEARGEANAQNTREQLLLANRAHAADRRLSTLSATRGALGHLREEEEPLHKIKRKRRASTSEKIQMSLIGESGSMHSWKMQQVSALHRGNASGPPPAMARKGRKRSASMSVPQAQGHFTAPLTHVPLAPIPGHDAGR